MIIFKLIFLQAFPISNERPGVRFSKIAAETDAYYVVTTPSEKGFAIIASDDAMPNLLAGYSLERQAPANPDAMPPQLKAWLHDYSAIVKAVADGMAQMSLKIAIF